MVNHDRTRWSRVKYSTLGAERLTQDQILRQNPFFLNALMGWTDKNNYFLPREQELYSL